MRKCLVDNSTVTAVDRLLGHVPVDNYHQIDGDIVALENLIQAILFHDEMFFVDDYKEEYLNERKSRYGFLTPLKQKPQDYLESVNIAREIVQRMAPALRESRFDDADFAPFIEMLKMNMAFSWRFHSSVYWLTVNMLTHAYGKEIHKYSRIWETIRSQLTEVEKNSGSPQELNSLLLHERDGTSRDIKTLKNTEGVYSTVEYFLGSLSWLAFRTTFYSIIGQISNLNVVIHPIRHAFRTNLLHRYFGMGTDAYSSIMAAMNDRIKATTNEILHSTQPIITRIELPYFSAHLVQKTGDVRNILDAAFELREDKKFKDARRLLMDLENTNDQKEYVKKINKIILDIEKTALLLKSEYGASDKQGIQTGPMIAVENTVLDYKFPSVNLPEIDVKFPLPDFVTKKFGRKKFQGIFRSIVEDLTAVERLGHIRTKLAAAANKKWAERHNAPTENPRYFGVNSKIRRWQ